MNKITTKDKAKYFTAPDGFRSKYAWRVHRHLRLNAHGRRFPRRTDRHGRRPQ